MSIELYKEALKFFPGGVNSPVRAKVRPHPLFVSKAKGSRIFTEEGFELIDYIMGYGPLILGHSNEYVLEAVKNNVVNGWLYGNQTKFELELARKITKYYPSIEKLRFVNSGAEAVTTAIRLARGYTGRKEIIMFDGCYHGAVDSLMVKEEGGEVVPYSHGVPEELMRLTHVCQFNDPSCVESITKNREIAAIVVEPVMANVGVVLPEKDFLRDLYKIASENGSLLILDEVVTGFRLSLGGAQQYFNVKAHITTLGKIIGGGFPAAAIGAKKEIMDFLTPSGRVFNAGTFNAHPISMVAGLYTIEVLERLNPYHEMRKITEELVSDLRKILEERGLKFAVNQIESMFQVFLDVKEVKNAIEARKANNDKYIKLAEEMVKRGILIPPVNTETWFVSLAHTLDDIEITIKTLKKASEVI